MNRVMPPDELVDRICKEREIVNKNKSAFSSKETKEKHDRSSFDKEVARINKEFKEL